MCNYNEQMNEIITSNIDSNLFNSFEEELHLSTCDYDFLYFRCGIHILKLAINIVLKGDNNSFFKNIRQLRH